MARMTRNAWKTFGDYFAAFDERAAGGPRFETNERGEGGDASCAFCLAVFVAALGLVGSAATATAAAPF